jgi:hypothetical protein
MAAPPPERREADWEAHYNSLIYYHAVRVLVDHISTRAKSLIDVGSAGYPYLNWFPHIERRVSLDLKKPFVAPGVESITTDFLKFETDEIFDIATCFQVMEHVPDPKAFAEKLLTLGKTVVISVPYKWQRGWAKTHIQDPVDETKLLSWFGRKPNFEYICHEIRIERPRIIQVYERNNDRWKYTGDRNRMRVARVEALKAQKKALETRPVWKRFFRKKPDE